MKKQAKRTVKKMPTVTICSSAAFYKQVIETREILKKRGFKVQVPLTAGKMESSGDYKVETYKTWHKDPSTYSRKTFLTKDHFKKIVKGDSVLVLNHEKNGRPGYIGGAVLAEMAIALYFGKKIYVLNPLQEDVSYKEELYAMQPVILNGDLGLIK